MDYDIGNSTAGDDEHLLASSLPPEGPHQVPSVAATVIGSIIMLVFFVEGLLGTVLIMVALLGKTDLRKSVVNVFVVSLCANDVCTILLVVDLIIDSYVWRRWGAGDLLCRLNPELTVAFTGCTLWHTALIAVHRYLVVVHPSAYKRLSKRAYTAFVLVAARAVPFACCLPGLTNLGESELPTGYVPKLLRCVLPSDDRRRIMAVTTMLTIVPCVVVVACYTAVLVFVAAAACRVKNTTMRRELRVSAIFGAIFLVVLGGFTPYTVVRSVDRDYRMDADVYVAVSVCYAVATCSSPLVYGALSTQIRQACMEILADMAAAVGRWWNRCCGRHGRCCLGQLVGGVQEHAPVVAQRDASTAKQLEGETVQMAEIVSLDQGGASSSNVIGSRSADDVML